MLETLREGGDKPEIGIHYPKCNFKTVSTGENRPVRMR